MNILCNILSFSSYFHPGWRVEDRVYDKTHLWSSALTHRLRKNLSVATSSFARCWIFTIKILSAMIILGRPRDNPETKPPIIFLVLLNKCILRYVVVKTWRLEERLYLSCYLWGLVVRTEKGSYGKCISFLLFLQLSVNHRSACCWQTHLQRLCYLKRSKHTGLWK